MKLLSFMTAALLQKSLWVWRNNFRSKMKKMEQIKEETPWCIEALKGKGKGYAG